MKRNQNKRNKRKFKIKKQQNHPLNFDRPYTLILH